MRKSIDKNLIIEEEDQIINSQRYINESDEQDEEESPFAININDS